MSQLLPWQTDTWQQLMRIQAAGRLPHALIIAGPEGIGKLMFAHHLAHFLMCLQPAAGTPCGHCKSCMLIDAESHPDVRNFAPEEDGRILKVDQIRDLNEFILKTPQQGRRKIAILHPAEAMNLNAANALLKTLEEPSADAMLILVSGAPGQLLPTIRSRCQVQTLGMPEFDRVVPWLLGQLSESSPGTEADREQRARHALRVTSGAPLKALALLQGDALAVRQQMLDDLAALLKRQQSPLEVAAGWHKLDAERTLHWLYQWLADVLKLQALRQTPNDPAENETARGVGVIDEQAFKMLDYVAQKTSPLRLHELLDEMGAALRAIRANQNPNVQLMLESILNHWFNLLPRKRRA